MTTVEQSGASRPAVTDGSGTSTGRRALAKLAAITR